MFKAVVLGALHNLSDEQLDHQLRDRLSFMRFLGLGLEDPTPDARRHDDLALPRAAGPGGAGRW